MGLLEEKRLLVVFHFCSGGVCPLQTITMLLHYHRNASVGARDSEDGRFLPFGICAASRCLCSSSAGDRWKRKENKKNLGTFSPASRFAFVASEQRFAHRYMAQRVPHWSLSSFRSDDRSLRNLFTKATYFWKDKYSVYLLSFDLYMKKAGTIVYLLHFLSYLTLCSITVYVLKMARQTCWSSSWVSHHWIIKLSLISVFLLSTHRSGFLYSNIFEVCAPPPPKKKRRKKRIRSPSLPPFIESSVFLPRPPVHNCSACCTWTASVVCKVCYGEWVVGVLILHRSLNFGPEWIPEGSAGNM